MKRTPYLMSFLLVPFIFIFTSFQKPGGISDLTEKILSYMEYYVEDVPEEKVFVHMDKNLYAAGDNVWFSVFLTAGSPDVPSPLSKVVYVDLLDNEGTLLQQKTVQIQEGHGYGDFKLDFYMREGIYHIHAYSHWLRGFGREAVFRFSIEILEPYNLKFQPSVEFQMAEAGNMVKYQAMVKALNRSLQPLKGETIIYEVLNRNRVLKSGSFQLDDEGAYNLDFSLLLSDLQQVTAIELTQKENEEYSISRKFLLPFPASMMDIQFLPEGGDLVSGFNNKVAIRAVYPDGTPIILSGSVNVDGQEVVFNTNESGLGSFSFTPQNGKLYRANIQIGESKLEIPLPQVKSTGVNLAVDNSKENLLNVLIQANAFNEISPSGEGLLVIHARGRIGHMQVINLANGVTGARINKNQLAPGINQVTVFEPEGTPLAERLVFIPQEKDLKLKLKIDEVNTRARGKNKWKLEIEGEGFEGGNYSVSVTDANEVPYSLTSNIISYLKIESELKGRIHQPKQFFSDKRDDEGIELIMLTHGWRRFNWESVLEGKIENKNFIEQGINITGTVSPKSEGKRGLTGGIINVFSKGKQEDFIAVEFGENGKFIIDDLDFQDTTLLTISANDRRHKELVNLELDPPLSKYEQWEGFNPEINAFEISPVLREYLKNVEKRKAATASYGEMEVVEIDEFVVQSEKFDPTQEEITRIYGKGDASLRPEDIGGFEGYVDIWQLLQGRFAGVRIIPSPMGGAPTIQIRGVGSIEAGGAPLVLLDNSPIDPSFAGSISPRELASVEVFKDAATLAVFGTQGANGAIALYTKRFAGIGEMGDGVFNLRFPGYSIARQFYMPRYDNESNPAPDYRSTLFWNPKIIWNGNQADIEFFNNDVVQKYKVVVQGIDKSGRLSYLEQEINP
ncbi:TonB-dependent receptor plug domain-containing protein [Shivajiella indica]|uniref:TonB-dependent receptor plug domain-containing protein n=1 Tax=Shivajiella indica TaxID=872115 RepID=A0ABW5B5Q3_9BACT